MIRLTIPRGSNWLWLALSGAGALLILLLAGALRSQPVPASGATFPTGRSGRHYYLTEANFDSDQALTACAAGYHMAAMWEIVDPSSLIYDANHPDAHTKMDSGQGPPSFWYGRVRTGQDASTSATAGTGNCNNWTSVDAGDSGAFVRLSRTWETPPSEIGGIWEVETFTCNVVGPVWCVGDFNLVYLPAVLRE